MEILTTKFLLCTSLISLTQGTCPPDYSTLSKWSDPNTWGGTVPSNGNKVNITSTILLDTVTNDLAGVVLKDSGRLVFDPSATLAKLVADYVLIENGGTLEIGSDGCKFSGKAEILLTGKRNSAHDVGKFGQKFIAVDEGGSLEIHGEERVSWSLLNRTLSPKKKLFESVNTGGEPSNKNGIILYEFFSNGTLKRIESNMRKANELKAVLNQVASDAILVISKYKQFSCSAFENKRFLRETLEEEFNFEDRTLKLDQMTMSADAYLLMIDLKSKTFNQSINVYEGPNDSDGTITELLTITVNDVVYNAQTWNNPFNKGTANKIFVESYNKDYFNNDIVLVDSVDWDVNDEVVIASTDYDFEQAEQFIVTKVDGKQVSIFGEVDFEHWGEFYEGVDMRAEVGLLTRNVKIHGKMEAECYMSDVNDCDEYNFDNFGGHTIAVEGFKSYNIDGAEIFHMGQTSVLGKYPLHVHMALNTTRPDGPTTLKNNAIHSTFQRCITIHTSHHVNIINNMAYDHIGHCYFLEDGAEKHTYIDGNLGLGTKKGFLIPSDTQPSTFWITSPETTVINNRAAGSHSSTGVGFWYLFPDEPVGPSRNLSIYGYREAKYTPITKFKDNVAHSNGNIGLALFRRLGESHEIIDCSTYSPRQDPSLGKDSELQPVVFDGFHGYKNKKMNVVMRSTSTELINFYVADSLVGVQFVRNMLGGYQRIRNSTVIGESGNLGLPTRVRVSADGVSPTVYEQSPRSLPDYWRPNKKVKGVEIRAEGPTHIENVNFINFLHNSYRKASAIAWYDDYHHHNGAVTSAKGLTFSYTSPSEGYNIVEWDEIDGRGDPSIMITDKDGSLTGTADSVVVKPDMYFSEGDTCTTLNERNLVSCNAKYSKFYLWPMPADNVANATYIATEDFSKKIDTDVTNMRISYTVSNLDLYILNWNVELPNSFNIKMSGLNKNDEIIIGMCLPQGSKNVPDSTKLYNIEVGTTISEASSLQDLKDSADKNIFFDTSKEILYRKFTETRDRTENDLGDCIGGLKSLDACQMLNIKIKWGFENGHITDRSNAKCDSR